MYSSHNNAFKINLGFGFILYNTISGQYKYHYVSANNMLFEKAVQISEKKDLMKLMNHIISLDLPTNYYLKKPSSSWVLAGLVNVEIFIFEMKHIPIGNPIDIPDYIKNAKSMYYLVRRIAYTDNNCFFVVWLFTKVQV